jgi:hypothetical protein
MKAHFFMTYRQRRINSVQDVQKDPTCLDPINFEFRNSNFEFPASARPFSRASHLAFFEQPARSSGIAKQRATREDAKLHYSNTPTLHSGEELVKAPASIY